MSKPVAHYSASSRAGDLLFVSGQLGLLDGALVDGVEAQTRQALENMKGVLADNGASLADIARRRAPRIPGVLAFRGAGCLLGLVLDRPAKPVANRLIDRGFLVGTSNDPDCLRLCPPAVMPKPMMEAFFDALEAELSE